jgi:MinD-like ATPase involved in chromosome partitioning or flagellar assembly
MENKHQEYTDAVEQYAEQQLDYVLLDIEEELDNIETLVQTESSKILLVWVRDSITRVIKNYKR